MNGSYGWYSARARAAFLSLSMVIVVAAPFAAAQTVPTVQAQFSSSTIDLTSPGIVTVTLSATTGDLAGCTLSNVHIGPATPIILSSNGHFYKAAFNKSDLAAVLPAFNSVDGIITGTLQCNGGVSNTMIAHATASVLKATTVTATVKPTMTIGGSVFKDLNGNGQLDPYEDWRLPVAQRVEDLLSRMTLAEKAGLMHIVSFSQTANAGNIQNLNIHYLTLRGGFATAGAAASSLNDWQKVAEGTRLGIPLVMNSNPLNNLGGGDAVFEPGGGPGLFSVWPGTLGMAATNDPQLIKDFAEIAREEWRATGIRKDYGYQVDVATEPRWTRNRTTFGEGPALNASITRSIVLGFQGQQLGPDSIAQTIKHFPGHGPEPFGLDAHNAEGQFTAYPTPGSLFAYHIVPFQAAVDAGTSAIMSYYPIPSNSLSGVQLPTGWWQSPTQQFEEVGAAFNKTLITTLLRGYMGFKGYVNTDSGVMCNPPGGTCTDWGVTGLTIPQRYAKAVNAGVSLFSEATNPQPLIDAVNQGLLAETDLNPSVRFLLTEMFNLGLFENPYVDPAQAQAVARSAGAQMVADQAHRESIVLMRNDQHALPYTNHVNLYVEVVESGTAAATQTAALKALFANDPVVHIVDNVAQANAALLWLFPTQVELADKSRIDIALSTNTGIDVAHVQQIEAAVPTVLAVNLATAWVMDNVEPQAAAVIGTYDVTAQALIDLIRGRFQPTGKLVMSIPANEAALEASAVDVPGYLEAFNYSYKNAVGDTYIFGFGKSGF
jgi:beta-glucosidase